MDAGTIVAISFAAFAVALIIARGAWYLCSLRRGGGRDAVDREHDLQFIFPNVTV